MGTVATLQPLTPPQTTPAPVALTPLSSSGSGSSGLSFSDILDTINPLQHIPIVSGVYRSLTGGTISSAAQVAGDTIYGAVLGGTALVGAALGFASSVANVAVQQTTGQDIAGNVLSGLASPSSTGASPAPVALTAYDPATSALVVAANNAGQNKAPVSNTIHAFFNQAMNPVTSNAEYTRAQALDATNQQLVKVVA